MTNFYDGELLDIIPANMKNDGTAALSYAIKRAMQRLQDFSQASAVYSAMDSLPESVLDLLAVELDTQYYDQTMPKKVKEQLITQTIAWYTHAGTPKVIEEFLGTVLDGGEIVEWYRYDGQPYCFKAYVQVGEHEIPLGYGKEVQHQIEIYKNVRSWLEFLAFVIASGFAVDVAYKTAVRFRSGFYPRYNLPRLKLNSLWKLSGKKLNCYATDEKVDFYPVYMNLRSATDEGIRKVERILLTTGAVYNITGVQSMASCGTAGTTPDTEQRIKTFVAVAEKVQTEDIRIMTVNKLSGKWKLGSKRKLNGGLSFL